MGRPVNKKYFGDSSQPGSQIVLDSVWLPGEDGEESGFWIVKQKGTRRFEVSNGSKSGIITLTDGDVTEGFGVVLVMPYGGGPIEHARTIYNRTVKTFEGNSYKWSTESASSSGEADLDMM